MSNASSSQPNARRSPPCWTSRGEKSCSDWWMPTPWHRRKRRSMVLSLAFVWRGESPWNWVLTAVIPMNGIRRKSTASKIAEREVRHMGKRRAISPDSVLHMLHRVLKRAGLPRIRFHDMRHTFATVALQNGVDVKTVSGMLGHYSAGFTLDTYAHVTTQAQRQAANTMANILSGAVED